MPRPLIVEWPVTRGPRTCTDPLCPDRDCYDTTVCPECGNRSRHAEGCPRAEDGY
jgi:hypothetical protein